MLRQLGQVDRERRLEGLWAGGGVREDLHVDPRRVRSGDPPVLKSPDHSGLLPGRQMTDRSQSIAGEEGLRS